MKRELTPEEFNRVMKYGLCDVCGEPRCAESRELEGLYPVVVYMPQHVLVLTCPNGHDHA